MLNGTVRLKSRVRINNEILHFKNGSTVIIKYAGIGFFTES